MEILKFPRQGLGRGERDEKRRARSEPVGTGEVPTHTSTVPWDRHGTAAASLGTMNDLLASVKGNASTSAQSHSRSARSASSGEDLESGGGGGPPSGGFLDDFFRQVAVIKKEINFITKQLIKLKDIHKNLKFQAQVQEMKDLRDNMQEEIDAVSKQAKDTKLKLEALKQSNEEARTESGAGSCEDRTRTSVTESLFRKLKDVMKEFADLREKFRDEHREEVKRYIYYQKREVADADEVNKLIESGESEELFASAVLEAGRGHIEDTLLEIAERREAVKDIEKKLLELYQIFIDMSALVEAQGEVLDNIEVQVSKSVDYVSSGTAALTTAKELQKKGRRLMCCSTLILLVILFAILMGVTKPWKSGSA